MGMLSDLREKLEEDGVRGEDPLHTKGCKQPFAPGELICILCRSVVIQRDLQISPPGRWQPYFLPAQVTAGVRTGYHCLQETFESRLSVLVSLNGKAL